MTTSIGLGILLLMQGGANEDLTAELFQQKTSPEHVSTSQSPTVRCSIYHSMGYVNLLYQELISVTFKTDQDVDELVQPLLNTYTDNLSKQLGKEAVVRVIDHVIQALPEVDHKAWAVEQLKVFKRVSQSRSYKLRSTLDGLADEERLLYFEKRSKERTAERLYHLLAKKAELVLDSDRKAEVIGELSIASSKIVDNRVLTRKYANLIRDLNLIGTPAPAVRFGDVLAEKSTYEITKGKVVVLISSTNRGKSEWSRVKARMPDLYEANRGEGLEVFTLLPPQDVVNDNYRDAVARYRVDYGIHWSIVQYSNFLGPLLRSTREKGVYFHPSNRSQLTIIDRKGVIRYVITEDSDYGPGYPFEKVKEKVSALLAEKS